MKSIYIGPFIHSVTLKELEICPNGAIGVDESGTIAFVERSDVPGTIEPKEARQGWEDALIHRIPGRGFYFPGFVGSNEYGVTFTSKPDTHIHASQYPNAGIFGESTLLDWLTKYTFPLEASLSSLSKAKQVYERIVKRTLSYGTTTAAYYATIDVEATNLLSKICHTRGQRAFVGRVCMDARTQTPDYYRDESADDALTKTNQCIDYIATELDPKGELVAPIITPRFAPSCSKECLNGLGKLHRSTGLLCQTHIAENKGELALVHELFPECQTYASVYDTAGLLSEKTVLAHAIHLTEEDKNLISSRGAKISHCPISNTALASGNARIRELLDMGLDVGLGTDVSGGYSVNMLEAARHAVLVSRQVAVAMDDSHSGGGDNSLKAASAKLSLSEALYLATRGGARVLGLENAIGAFEVGKSFDAQMILFDKGEQEPDGDELSPVDHFGSESLEHSVAKWFYCGDDRNCVAVWVKGRLVRGQVNSLDNLCYD